MVGDTILAMAAILTYFASRTSYHVLKVLAGAAWVGLGVWWSYTPFAPQGSPTMTIVLTVVFMAGVAIFFWGLWEVKYDKSGKEVGGRLHLPFITKSYGEESEVPDSPITTLRQRNTKYQARLDAASRGERR